MSSCVNERFNSSKKELESLELKILVQINNNQEAAYGKALRIPFKKSIDSFKKYRKEQCSFVYQLASIGNGAKDNQQACITQLNEERINQLRKTYWWFDQN